jgi:hypothetical protein
MAFRRANLEFIRRHECVSISYVIGFKLLLLSMLQEVSNKSGI